MLCYSYELLPERGWVMNFNVYLNKGLAERITRLAKNQQRSRNSIITEALEEWYRKHSTSTWDPGFFDFAPIEDVPDFKSLRAELDDANEDPLK